MTPREEIRAKLYSIGSVPSQAHDQLPATSNNSELSGLFNDASIAVTDVTERDAEARSVAQEITGSIRYNDWQDASWFSSDKYVDSGEVDVDKVEAVLDTYTNLMLEEKNLAPYNAEDKNNYPQWDKLLNQKSARTEDLCHKVMTQLYWGTKDGRIRTTKFLYPSEYEKNKKYTRVNKRDKAKMPWDNIPWKTIAVVAGGGVLLFFGSKIISDVKTISG